MSTIWLHRFSGLLVSGYFLDAKPGNDIGIIYTIMLMPKKQRARWVSPDRGILEVNMNNLIITTRQSPVRLLVIMLPQPSCGHYLLCSYSYSH